jgi:elongation factor G
MNAIESIRNIAFLGHPGVGKTTLVDALAHATGVSARKGSVSDKTSICDTEPEEQEKAHTLQMCAVHVDHEGRRWTFLDTPGYPDFVAEVLAAISVSEWCVGVVSCASGVSYNFRTKLEAAARLGRGRAVVVTHIDGENADFDELIENLREAVGESCVPVALPDHSGRSLSAVKSILGDRENPWYAQLIERVMDGCEDEQLIERYLETEELSEDELRRNLTLSIARGSVVPVFACNPESGLGLAEFLAFAREFAPNPSNYPLPVTSDETPQEIALDPEAPLLARVFAVRSDPHVGKVSLAKILRGTLAASHQVSGPNTNRPEKLGGLFWPVGKKKRDPLDAGRPGEIVCFSKVDSIGYGDCFTHGDGKVQNVPGPVLPIPMVSLAVAPKSRADEQKIGESLQKLAAEDPTFKTRFEETTHELVMSGMSDLHLQIMEHRLKRRYGVEISTHAPRIAYQQTISRPSEGHHRHKKQSGGRGQFGECYLRLRPLGKGEGFVFKDAVVGGAIPRNLIPAVEKGMREIVERGVLIEGKVVDLEVELYDGKFHAVDSDEASFKMAGARAFIEGFEKGHPVLLEPVMELLISVPTETAGSIFSDLTSHRRGHVIDQWNEANGAITVIKAHAPLSTVQTYHRDLKSQTAGEGSYSLQFSDYAIVPALEQTKILAERGKRREAEQ